MGSFHGDNEIERAAPLGPHDGRVDGVAGLAAQQLESSMRLCGRSCVQCCETTGVARRQGMQQIDSFGSSNLADDNSVWAQPQRRGDKSPQVGPIGGDQTNHVRMNRRQLGDIFDNNNAFTRWHLSNEGTDERRFACSSWPNHQDRTPSAHSCSQDLGVGGVGELGEGQPTRRHSPDRHIRTLCCGWRQHHGGPVARRQNCMSHGMTGVGAGPTPPGHPVNQEPDPGRVERDTRVDQLASSLDENQPRTVDQDVSDFGLSEEHLDVAETIEPTIDQIGHSFDLSY